MRLLISTTSPYARKVRMVIQLLKLDDMVDIEVVNQWEDDPTLAKYNPLMKVPTLIMPNDQALTESHLIVDYFCSINPDINLLPMTVNVWQHVANMGFADGIIDSAIDVVIEKLKRPEQYHYQPWFERRFKTILNTLKYLEERAQPGEEIQLYEVSLACALGLLDYRLSGDIDWRPVAPKLAAWYEEFSKQPIMTSTEPGKPL